MIPNAQNVGKHFAMLAFLALVVLCGGAIRGCSNDFDRRMGNPETFERWAW